MLVIAFLLYNLQGEEVTSAPRQGLGAGYFTQELASAHNEGGGVMREHLSITASAHGRTRRIDILQ